MLTDAHCHPFDLTRVFTGFEQESEKTEILAAASACDPEEFAHNEILSQKLSSQSKISLLACFGVHPQQPVLDTDKHLETLNALASQGRISAIGECGFDLYNSDFRKTEFIQERIFNMHLETAIRFELPIVLHVRRAIHKIFSAAKYLSKCKAVIFHSWSGTFEESQALLRRGINAYFSFGNIIILNHKQAMRSCALLPAERILTETDAPYQPKRGNNYSSWQDLPQILEGITSLRCETENKTDKNELEKQVEKNFRKAFSFGS